MLVTVATDNGKSSQLEVSEDTLISTIKALVASELGVAAGAQIIFNGKPLSDGVTLTGAGVKDQDLLLVTDGGDGASGTAGAGGATRPRGPTLADVSGMEPNGMLAFFKENPQLLRQLHHMNSELAEALETRDVVKVRTCIMMQQMNRHKAVWTQETERAALFANPDSEESQAKIQKMIQQEAINQNYAMAMEETPEVFARVSMLYIDTEINGNHVKAFVDSGAQTTIMSAACAERCGLRLVDRRFHGEARGVGTGKIVGRIHMAQIKVGDHFFPCSLTILERSDVDFLFGLDMLKRHLCVIDLKKGELGLGSAGATVPFLSEKDLPLSARETQAEDLNRKPAAGTSEGGADPPVAREAAAGAAAAGAAAAAAGAAAAAATAAATTVAPAPASSGGVDETKVSQLVGMGFSRDEAVAALESTGGDAEQAAGLLLARMDD